jgi:hypothetical protein
MGSRLEGGDERQLSLLHAVALVLLAALPSLGTFGAPWIAEDAAILARVEADGPWADWGRGQYGMQVLRFWRPLVSTSWSLQESLSGIAPLPLRVFNVALHAGVALLVAATALRLGATRRGALVAGAWLALFPAQGGVVTWLAGRTDLLCALFLVASAWAALGRRALASAPLAFLAAASKEFGFLAPMLVLLLVRSGGARWSEAARRAAPAAAAVALAALLRARALGGWSGGYPLALPGALDAARGSLTAVLSAHGGALALAALGLGLGLALRSARPRAVAHALAAALLLALPLVPLLADGVLEAENRRLLYAPECALALAFGLAFGRDVPGTRARWLVLGVLLLSGVRFAQAWRDTRVWARSAAVGEAAVARARGVVAGAAPGVSPVLFGDFPSAHGGAYCLGFGLAARFRAPFPASPRPVWPWRLAFVEDARRRREPPVAARADGSLWPLDDVPVTARLTLLDEEGRALSRLELDERARSAPEDRSPRVVVAGGESGAPLELLIASEIGYEPFPAGVLDDGGRATFSAMQLLAAANGVASVAQLLAQTADLGGERAYVELRALAPEGAVRASSGWLDLGWTSELAARAR